MRIINLVENTEGQAGCGSEHGLCFYIETEHHKLLMDTGQTDLLIANAQKLGIDLTEVDTVVLSHGHYDHGGGILPFAKLNPEAKIYVPEGAFGEYYSVNKAGEPHYIGLSKEIQELPQVVVVGSGKPAAQTGTDAPLDAEQSSAESPLSEDMPAAQSSGIYRIDNELSLFSGIGNAHPIPSANRRLKVQTDEGLVQDDFGHEQCLVIHEGTKSVLLSGCAHHGILNVLDRYRELYGGDPDVVISGFHMMRKHGYSDEDINMIIDTALELRKHKTVFYTGHCTGIEPYSAMRKLMGDQLRYVHSGDEIRIRTAVERILWDAAERAASASAAAEDIRNKNGDRAQSKDSARSMRGEPPKDRTPSKDTKKRSEYMKWHRFFAWGTVACFIMTMVTGYKRK